MSSWLTDILFLQIQASFPNFKDTGHGKTESEARLKGILEIYANYLDKEKLISNEHKKMKVCGFF